MGIPGDSYEFLRNHMNSYRPSMPCALRTASGLVYVLISPEARTHGALDYERGALPPWEVARIIMNSLEVCLAMAVK